MKASSSSSSTTSAAMPLLFTLRRGLRRLTASAPFLRIRRASLRALSMAFPVSRRSGDDISGSSPPAALSGSEPPRRGPKKGSIRISSNTSVRASSKVSFSGLCRGASRSSEPRSLGAVKEASSSAARIDGAGRLPQSAKGDGAPVRTGFGDATSLIRGSAAIAGVRRGSTRSFVNHVSRVGAVTVSARSRGEKRVTQRVILLVRVVSALCGSAAASKLDGSIVLAGAPPRAIDRTLGVKPQARKTLHAPAARKRSPKPGQSTERGTKEESLTTREAIKSPTMPPRPLSRSQRAGAGNMAKNAGTASAAAAQ